MRHEALDIGGHPVVRARAVANNIRQNTWNTFQRTRANYLSGKKDFLRNYKSTTGKERARIQRLYDPSNGSVTSQISYKMWTLGASEEELEYFNGHYCDFLTCNGPLEALETGELVSSDIYEKPDTQVIGEIFAAGAASRTGALKKSTSVKPRSCNSFVTGTRVLMADGTSKPIEDLSEGDEVLATDPETGETSGKTITATIYTEDDKAYVDLTVQTSDGVKSITATGHHPFWSESDRVWKDAEELKAGETLRADDGSSVVIAAVRAYEAFNETYNLTVADLHTYYVLAGVTPCWYTTTTMFLGGLQTSLPGLRPGRGPHAR